MSELLVQKAASYERRLLICVGLIFSAALIFATLVIGRYISTKPEPVRTGVIGDNEYEPAQWGKVYPLEYESWLQTKDPRTADKSKYKRGWDTDRVIYDKLSEYPYMGLLYNGWGFGVEYNEPRGHSYMMIDQFNIDSSRTKAGASCLTCKTPYINKLIEKNGNKFFLMSYLDGINKIPEQHRSLGVACIDCHDNKTMSLKISRWTIKKSLEDLGKSTLNRQEMRSIVCAQCHVTYIITRDTNMKPTDIILPWKKSKWGDISIENIIQEIKSEPANLEWKQNVTGFKVGYIRHPEFEFYSRNSIHWNAGVSCADCHMPYKMVGTNKISDHNVMSPLKNDMKGCIQCHGESPEWLKAQVIAIQDRIVSLMNRAGYATAVTAKLFELANKVKTFDEQFYAQAQEFYLQSLYRIIFLGGENSVGFHNPVEAARIAGDAIAFASKAESLLRQMLSEYGIKLPVEINLTLSKYINNRGNKKLSFLPEQEIEDPSGIQNILLSRESKGF